MESGVCDNGAAVRSVPETTPIWLRPPPPAYIGGRCLIRDKRAGQCRAHHIAPGFAHHANNCQAPGRSSCSCTLIDSSLLTRFMGVGTFVSVASNWSAAPLAGGPGPWAGQLSSPCERQRMNYPHAATVPVIPDQPPRGNHRCAFNQARPLKCPRRAARRVNMAVSQGSPLCRGRTRP